MQGGVINRNSVYTIPASEITRFVAAFNYGIFIGYKRVGFDYSITRISSETKKGLNHGWGRVGINVCF
jgi:lipid A 3-O-deacylase